MDDAITRAMEVAAMGDAVDVDDRLIVDGNTRRVRWVEIRNRAVKADTVNALRDGFLALAERDRAVQWITTKWMPLGGAVRGFQWDGENATATQATMMEDGKSFWMNTVATAPDPVALARKLGWKGAE
jgi:hypothetical protein